jgi:hypothetical protein
MFPAQSAIVHRVITIGRTPVDLCRDDQVVALPAKLLDCLSHADLAFAAGVALGAVEEVDCVVWSEMLGGGRKGGCSVDLLPASHAAFMMSKVRSSSTWPPYVSHPPREMAETWRPLRPRKRSGYGQQAVFSMFRLMLSSGYVFPRGGIAGCAGQFSNGHWDLARRTYIAFWVEKL